MSSVVLKSTGKNETYDARKVKESVRKALLSAQVTPEEAEAIADSVTAGVTSWISDKQHVTSREVRAQAAHLLRPLNHVAYYLYEKHRILS